MCTWKGKYFQIIKSKAKIKKKKKKEEKMRECFVI